MHFIQPTQIWLSFRAKNMRVTSEEGFTHVILFHSRGFSGPFFAPNLSWLNKMHWLKWRKTSKFDFSQPLGPFTCSVENMF